MKKRIRQWAAKEGIPPAEMYRRLLEWATDHYARAGGLAQLRAMVLSGQK